jgi:hypothetical protein
MHVSSALTKSRRNKFVQDGPCSLKVSDNDVSKPYIWTKGPSLILTGGNVEVDAPAEGSLCHALEVVQVRRQVS